MKVAGVAYGRQSRRTQRIKKTANPVWNFSLQFTLKRDAPTVYIAVFDKHRKYSLYLGELRLSLLDIFTEDSETGAIKTKVEPQWYKLRSSKSQNTFVTGEIKMGFQISTKHEKHLTTDFKIWKSTVQSFQKRIKIDDQDYYCDSDTDVESLLDTATDSNGMSKENINLHHDTPHSINNSIYLQAPPAITNSGTGTSGESHSEMSDNNQLTNSFSSINLRRPSKLKTETKISGVVFLEIISASGLPPLKGFTKARFDMDPFVVISFGKKTYRTSWRKHTLSPVFNEKLAFEVLNSEEDYNLVFNILDKDRISFHDKVAMGSIKLKDIINREGFVDFNLALTPLTQQQQFEPKLKLRVNFRHYNDLETELWNILISKFGENKLDIIQLDLFLENFEVSEEIMDFYNLNDKAVTDLLTIDEIIKVIRFENIQLKKCPFCGKRKKDHDMVSHSAICLARGDKLKQFATAGLASKRWYSKILIKFAYGKYALGKNNANILVQDRLTGFIIEEKMALYIRLGIRLLYKGKSTDSKRMKNLLRNLSIKQGARFDLPSSVKEIDSFIKFHQLDLSECLTTEFKTFNEFFYRKLKPGSRPPEGEDDRIIVSAADSRCTTFNNLSVATKIWIKSRAFTTKKLLGGNFDKPVAELFDDCSIAIFRLAPQDYHRFHSPVKGIIGKPVFIEGEYYTVNPMAIRSDLDVFGENVRVVIPIETKQFGLVFVIAVGAMMVGSIILSVKEGDSIHRADELGYFKFGGSTVLTLFQKGTMEFDTDLVSNSNECIETLVRVGMSVGHSPEIEQFQRNIVKVQEPFKENMLKIIRTISGGNSEKTWEIMNLNLDHNEEEIDEEYGSCETETSEFTEDE